MLWYCAARLRWPDWAIRSLEEGHCPIVSISLEEVRFFFPANGWEGFSW